ncbi:MAG TPA: fatty acid desaturase [Steroidobacteraceae bacterium]|nr:fatty acid desaturase [Steroidobacteraceae bacterium]
MNGKFWRYSRWDALLALLAAGQMIATVLWAINFKHMHWGWNAVIFPAMALLFYFNPIVIVHNFLHCPFFQSQKLNKLFAALNSTNLGIPQILYKYHHVTHHRFSNDPLTAGTTSDPSSTFRFGKEGKQEHWMSYAAFSLFRDATTQAYKKTVSHNQLPQLVLESIFLVAGLALLLAIDWQWFLLMYVPLFYVGWFLAHTENYFEHFNAADHGSRFANSVSYYPRWYNRLMFNEGFHQEHHLEPGRHWTQRPTVREKYGEKMKAAGAYAARFPPLLGFLD